MVQTVHMSVDELAHIGKPFDLKIEKDVKLGWYFTIRSYALQDKDNQLKVSKTYKKNNRKDRNES